jgi:hypothetical protein
LKRGMSLRIVRFVMNLTSHGKWNNLLDAQHNEKN